MGALSDDENEVDHADDDVPKCGQCAELSPIVDALREIGVEAFINPETGGHVHVIEITIDEVDDLETGERWRYWAGGNVEGFSIYDDRVTQAATDDRDDYDSEGQAQLFFSDGAFIQEHGDHGDAWGASGQPWRAVPLFYNGEWVDDGYHVAAEAVAEFITDYHDETFPHSAPHQLPDDDRTAVPVLRDDPQRVVLAEAERGMTVHQLRELLAHCAPGQRVLIASDGWYDYIGEVQLPDGHAVMLPTLYPGQSYDPRDPN